MQYKENETDDNDRAMRGKPHFPTTAEVSDGQPFLRLAESYARHDVFGGLWGWIRIRCVSELMDDHVYRLASSGRIVTTTGSLITMLYSI